MSENISQAQHITELDFDISKIYAQFKELERATEAEAKKLASLFSDNIKISDVVNAEKAAKGLTQADGEAKKFADSIEKINNNQKKMGELAEESTKKTEKLGNAGQSMGQKFSNYMMYRAFGYIEQGVRSAATAIKETESIMAELTRVMDDGSYVAKEYRSSLFSLAADYGRNFTETSDVALRFAQAGYDVAESLSATEDALLALNTAELNSEQATQSLVGILAQWGMEASELIDVIDKVNKTADNYALTSQDLVDGLLRSSGAAKNANMSLDETIGVLTVLRQTTGRTGREIGNAVNSIISYTQRASSLNIFEGLGIKVFEDEAKTEISKVTDIWAQVSEQWKSAQVNGEAAVQAFLSNAESAGMLSEELAIATDTLDEYNMAVNATTEAEAQFSDVQKREAAQASAGVFRRNYFISLMENLGMVTEVTTGLMDAQGYSARENAIYMETLEAKMNELVTRLQELAVSAADAGLLDLAKSLIDAASGVSKFVSSTGGLKNALTVILGVVIMLKKQALEKGIRDVVTNLGTSIPMLRKVVLGLNGVKTAQDGAASSAIGLGTALNTALGVIGLVVTAIGILKMAYDGISQAEKERVEAIRQAAEENAKATKDEYINVVALVDEYKILAAQTDRTEETKARLKEIQDELIKTYGLEAEGIDLVNGKYKDGLPIIEEYSKAKLDDAIRAAQADLNQSREDAIFDGTFAEAEKLIEKIKHDSDEMRSIQSATGIFNNLTNELSTLLYSEFLGKGTMSIRTGSNVREVVDELEELLDILESGNHQQTELYTSLSNAYSKYKTQLDELNSKEEERINLLIKKQQLDGTTYFSGQSYAYEQLKNQVDSTASTITEASKRMINAQKQQAEDEASILEERAKRHEELAKEISATESEMSSLNGVIRTLNETGVLNADTVMDLIGKYPELASQIEVVEGGYKLETKALETLLNVKINSAIDAQRAEAELTKATIIETNTRIAKYKEELLAIQSRAEAQAAILKYDSNIGNFGNFEERLRQGTVSRSEMDAYNEIMSAINAAKDIEDLYAAIELLGTSVYKSIGKTSSTKSEVEKLDTATKSTAASLSDLTSAFDHYNSMGFYTIQQQIMYYEQLRNIVSLTAQEQQTVSQKLHGLYKQQIQEQIDLAQKEYNNRINSVTKYYDELIKREQEIKDARNSERQEDDYEAEKAKLQEELAYWSERTGATAEENRQRVREEIAKHELDRTRRLEDDKTDTAIKAIEEKKQKEISALEKTWKRITEVYNEANLNMIASAGIYANDIYNQFHNFLTTPFTSDINSLSIALAGLVNVYKTSGAGSGLTIGTGSSGSTSTGTGTSTPKPSPTPTPTPTPTPKPSTPAQTSPPANGAGSQVSLSKDSLYSTAYDTSKANTLTGGYYLYDGINVNGRYRITNSPANVGKKPIGNYVTGWVNASDIVKARTGGEIKGEGALYVHPNEFIANSEITHGLRAIVKPEVLNGLKEMVKPYMGGNKTTNNTSYNNSNSTERKIEINAPLYNVEKIEVRDNADVDILESRVSRAILQQIERKP